MNHVVSVRRHVRLLGGRAEAHARAKFCELTCPDVGRHDDDGVAEVDLSTQAVCQLTVVQGLQKQIEHVRVGFFNLVQQHNGVGATAYLFSELSSFFVADVARRRSNQPRHGKLLHVLGHVDADQRFFRVKHERGKHLGQLRFANAGGAQEYE